MMRPEDELDEWLDLSAHGDPTIPLELREPLEAADRVASLASITPSHRFASALEQRFLAQASAMAAADEPNAEEETLALACRATDGSHARATPSRRRARRILWPTIAAAVLIVFSMATLFAAANAAPGSPLYGLHRWEQGVNVTLADGPAERARLHLRYATDALTALDASATRHESDHVYRDALSSFQDEMRSAATAVNQVADSQTRAALGTQLDALRAQARDDFHAVLPALGWSARLETTTALGQVGGVTPQITQVTVTSNKHDGAAAQQYIVTGSGFLPGAVLVVDGRQVGVTISVSPTTLIASAQMEDREAPHSVGVSNPDGTAAQTTHISSQDGDHDQNGGDQQNGPPSSQDTPTPGNEQNGGLGGNSSRGGGSGDTPRDGR